MMDSRLAISIRAPMSLTARPIRRFMITIENRRTYAAKNTSAVPDYTKVIAYSNRYLKLIKFTLNLLDLQNSRLFGIWTEFADFLFTYIPANCKMSSVF